MVILYYRFGFKVKRIGYTMKTITLISIPLFFISLAHAEISKIVCPTIQQLQYEALGNQRYHVSAQSDVLQGSIPAFELTGESLSDQATHFSWDQFIRKNSNGESVFTCAYQGLDKAGKSISFEIKAVNAPWLQWCYVEGHGQSQCQGNRMNCILQCEMLLKNQN